MHLLFHVKPAVDYSFTRFLPYGRGPHDGRGDPVPTGRVHLSVYEPSQPDTHRFSYGSASPQSGGNSESAGAVTSDRLRMEHAHAHSSPGSASERYPPYRVRVARC